MTGQAVESTRLDRFVAIAAGPANWRDDRHPTSADLAAGCLELTALGAILTVTLTAADGRHLGAGWVPFALVAALAVILLAIAGPTATWVFGSIDRRRRRFVDLRLVAVWRTTGFAIVVALWALVVGGVHPQDGWMFGMVLGCEATLGARSIGATMHPWRWWRQFLVSIGHVVAVGVAVVAGIVVGGTGGILAAVAVYGAVQFATFVGAFQTWVLERIRTRLDTELREHVAAYEHDHHRSRAHWLHDDVCSELRLLRLQLETDQIEPDEIAGRLDELDHRLRIRQLDELLKSGRVRLAEVIQPFVRRAQAHGLRLREVPRFEQASLEIDEHTGRMVQRAAAVLVTNSIQAGATEIGIHATLDREAGRFELRFDDDAGGFDHLVLPPGRGLDSLTHDLAPGALELTRTDAGTSARVVFALSTKETT